MVVFAKDFGSEDPLADAVDAARWMVERDYLGFRPHIGIAAGEIVVGYVGTPLKYNCSVYGRAVTLAQRCCQVDAKGPIVIPTEVWKDRRLEQVLSKRKVKQPNNQEFEIEIPWEISPPRKVMLKEGKELEIVEIIWKVDEGDAKVVTWVRQSAEDRAKEAFEALKAEGAYKPKRYPFEDVPKSLK